jgi:hypothetical protein
MLFSSENKILNATGNDEVLTGSPFYQRQPFAQRLPVKTGFLRLSHKEQIPTVISELRILINRS